MTEENETLDFHEFVLKLPDSAWNLSSESLDMQHSWQKKAQ